MPYEKLEIGGLGSEILSWMNHPISSDETNMIRNMSKLPCVYRHISIMADGHLGKGAVIGTVMATKNALIPAVTGVDIGCTDMHTEFLTPEGWKFISDYQEGDKVLQYDLTKTRAEFVEPISYIKLPCSEFNLLKTKYGINQALSDEHKVLYFKGGRENIYVKSDTISASELVKIHKKNILGFGGRFETSFFPILDTEINLSNEEIRVMVMVFADGSFGRSTNRCNLHFRKIRKINRAKELLVAAKIKYDESIYSNGDVSIKFYAPLREKSYGIFWKASAEQLKVIIGEVFYWDGNVKLKCFYTRDKISADFIHYAVSASGYRGVLRKDTHKDGKTDYRIFAFKNTKIGLKSGTKTEITQIPSEDGFKYCFTLPSGFWIMRRGGNIVITGNCGMNAVLTPFISSDLGGDRDLRELRTEIESQIPVGFNKYGNSGVPKLARDWKGFNTFTDLHSGVQDRKKNAMLQLGTLGGGNHFIEVCLDTDNRVWLMLHSGSRNIGKELAERHISTAKTLHRLSDLPDPDLAYFVKGTEEFKNYWKDLQWTQDYAMTNREVMMEKFIKIMSKRYNKDKIFRPLIEVNCHHNYASEETHFGDEVIVTRKGAVNAEVGRLGIIPGSMGTKSFIVRGLGNPESYNSCSHGAGRRMSRGQAKRTYTLEDFKEQTKGVECRKDIIDEIPSAYKDIRTVMDNQNDLVEIIAELKQVVCVKG